MTLGDAQVGSTVVVTKIEGDGAYKRRIMDMGITKGTELYIRKVAPERRAVRAGQVITELFFVTGIFQGGSSNDHEIRACRQP